MSILRIMYQNPEWDCVLLSMYTWYKCAQWFRIIHYAISSIDINTGHFWCNKIKSNGHNTHLPSMSNWYFIINMNRLKKIKFARNNSKHCWWWSCLYNMIIIETFEVFFVSVWSKTVTKCRLFEKCCKLELGSILKQI